MTLQKNSSLLNHSVLKVKEGVEASLFDDGNKNKSYLIKMDNRHWKVSEVVYNIFCSLDGNRTIGQIREYLIDKYLLDIDEQKIEQIVQLTFVNNGILEGTTAVTVPPKDKMLWLRITLIKPEIIKKFQIFSFLFNKKCLKALGSIALAWVMYILYSNSNTEVVNKMFKLDIKDIFLCYVFIFSAGLIHELGHSLATMSYGVSPGRIGLGVYFIMPILFSDVSRIWKLKRTQRIIVDLGGVYLQGVFLVFSFLLNYFFVKSTLLNIAILISGFQILGDFNPFIKFDGYWVLVDYLGITEIKPVMSQLWGELFCKVFHRPHKPVVLNKTKKIVIFGYSILTACFFIYFFRFLVDSSVLAIKNIIMDISLFLRLFPSGLNITYHSAIGYISGRITTFIVLFFLFRFIWLYVVKKLIARLKKNRKESHCATN